MNALRDLIRDYTQTFDHKDVNKRLEGGKITKEVLEEMLYHKDTAKSMATFGVNKIFAQEKQGGQAFEVNKLEKLILGLSIAFIVFWSLF